MKIITLYLINKLCIGLCYYEAQTADKIIFGLRHIIICLYMYLFEYASQVLWYLGLLVYN